MKIIKTDQPFPSSETEKLWIYNGLDSCITREVFDVIEPQLDNLSRATYEFSKALQGPVLEMKLRGVKVDLRKRDEVVNSLEQDLARIGAGLARILREGFDIDVFNWRSPIQLKEFFYGALGLAPIRYQGKVTVNRDALEKLQSHFHAQPIINHILALRDISKKISVLRSEIDPDDRIRTSYNIAGTNNDRFSSSFTDFGTGTNLQNIELRLREIFVADKGMKFAQLDAAQGESRCVGAIEWNKFHDETYLSACETGDLHTAVCRMAWSNLQWTGDIRLDREIAERPFYRQHSFRHMAKVLGHGTNYAGTPITMAKHTKIDSGVIKDFQSKYFKGFPGHIQWHVRVAADLARDGYLVSLLGRRRHFLGRLTDPATIREAIAFDPQTSLARMLNQGMLQVWRANICQLLMQIHDAILVQYPTEQEDEIIPQLKRLISVPVELAHGRTLVIPYEVKTGWNWSDFSEKNPDGLKKYDGSDKRNRTEAARWMDQAFR
jgi:DNA polymerase I